MRRARPGGDVTVFASAEGHPSNPSTGHTGALLFPGLLHERFQPRGVGPKFAVPRDHSVEISGNVGPYLLDGQSALRRDTAQRLLVHLMGPFSRQCSHLSLFVIAERATTLKVEEFRKPVVILLRLRKTTLLITQSIRVRLDLFVRDGGFHRENLA